MTFFAGRVRFRPWKWLSEKGRRFFGGKKCTRRVNPDYAYAQYNQQKHAKSYHL